MNLTPIDWPGLTHTWNPMYGCKRGCGYCYARVLHNRRMEAKRRGAKLSKRYNKPFHKIQFFPEDLNIPKKSRVIKKIFVCSMGDICWQEPQNLEAVIGVCERRPEMIFMFLTKDPIVYIQHRWPVNCQLGITLTGQENAAEQRRRLSIIEKLLNFTYISYEPVIDVLKYEIKNVNMIIVGADSRKHNPIIPKKEWILSIEHDNIYFKDNIRKYL